MSKQMLCSFFPAHCSHIFQPFLPKTFALLYPQDVVETCPEQVVTIGTTAIRRPFLAIFALLGIITGIFGALRIHKRRKDDASSFYWMTAFLSFAGMNLSGLFLHCLLPPTEISALEHPVFWIGDTYTTGVFGAALWAAAMMESLPKGWNSNVQPIIQYAWSAGNLLGLAAIGWFLVGGYDPHSTIPGTLPLELWYATPPAFAFLALVALLVRQAFPSSLLYSFLLSYAVYWIGALDPFLCRQFCNDFWDLLTTPTLFFAATDIVFVGIGVWLEQRNHTAGVKKQL